MIKKLLLSGLILSTGLFATSETDTKIDEVNTTKTNVISEIDGAVIYNKCAGCHGVNGETPALNKSAIITGQDTALTIKQLEQYKAGTLNTKGMGALMKVQVAALSEEEIKAVAKYISEMN